MRRREGEGAMRAASGAVAVATSLAVPSAALAQERPYEWGWGMHPMWGIWGAWGLGMALMMVVVWGVVIVAIVLGIRRLVGQGPPRRSDTAFDILRERYARGDMSKEEFDAKRRDLN